jgi:hypothetical protein
MLRQMSSELEANQELKLTVIPSLLPKHCLLVHSLLSGLLSVSMARIEPWPLRQELSGHSDEFQTQRHAKARTV